MPTKPAHKMTHPIHHVPENSVDWFAIDARKDEEEEEACSAVEAVFFLALSYLPLRKLLPLPGPVDSASRPEPTSVLCPSPFQPPGSWSSQRSGVRLFPQDQSGQIHSRPFKSIHSAIVTECLGSARYCSNLGTQQAKEKTLLHSWE